MTDSDRIRELARRLDAAERERTAVPLEPDLTLADGYAVQQASLLLRCGRGEEVVGWKLGLTSRAKMEQMGIEVPIYAAITDRMLAEDGATLDPALFLHPRVEPEIGFLMGDDLAGPTTAAEALRAVSGVCAALEVIDSRYQDFKFDLPNVVADNASCARVILGSRWLAAASVDVGNLGIVLEVDGRVSEIASSAAVLDHPARSLAVLVNLLGSRGQRLSRGQIVMTGGATAAVPLLRGRHVQARVERLGSASVRMGE